MRWERISPVSYTHLDVYKRQLSYGDGTMQIAGQGDIPMQSDKLPVYDETGTSPKDCLLYTS